jgi:putative nucleotidyltransferase with HDIG domain
MLKKIPIERLKPGMYVHDLGTNWFSHPFLRQQFKVTGEDDLNKISSAGIRELYIDTSKGLDDTDAASTIEVRQQIDKRVEQLGNPPSGQERNEAAPPARTTVAEELPKAKKIYDQAGRAVRSVMRDVRLGNAVNVAGVEDIVGDITDSVSRNSGALVSLLNLKEADDYTFLHCVAVGTLMVTFGRAMGLDPELVRQGGIGGLLHDVGKMKVPDAVLNKPGKLTDDEFFIIKKHPEIGHELLVATGAVGEIPLDITRHHHERMDGSGYPDKLPADQISLYARMSAIVDVYDAVTSDRCYHRAMTPTDAMRKMLEWSKFHFDETLAHQFMKIVGIYPVGQLVRLESGRLAVVTDQNETNLLMPKVCAFFSIKSNCHIPPVMVDLSRTLGHGGGDKIVGHENPHKWGVQPSRFLTPAK